MLFVRVVLNNFYDLVVAGLLAGLALFHTRRLLDLLFYGLCLGAGILIISQNAHAWGIITLFAAGVVAAETGLRSASVSRPRVLGWSGAPLLFWLLILPPLGKYAVAMTLYVALASSGFGTGLALPNFADVRFGRLWSPGDNGFTELYIGNFGEAAELLGQMDDPQRVLVLDFANPVSAGMGLLPPRGDISWMHWGRNLDAEHHPLPQELFADVAVVMIPKIGINSAQLEELYGPFIVQHYALFAETDGWTVYRLRESQ
jgi:hypothetical protein